MPIRTSERLPYLLLRTHGSVDAAVSGPVMLFTAWSLLVWLIHQSRLIPHDRLGSCSSSTLAIISGVLGLLLAFRHNSAYERYHVGRALWADIHSISRTLMRTLTLTLPPPAGRHDRAQIQATRETIAMLPAFAYALKDHLRDVDAVRCIDVKTLLSPEVYLQLSAASQGDAQGRAMMEKEGSVANLNTHSETALATSALPEYVSANIPLAILGQLHRMLNAFHTTKSPSAGSPPEAAPALETATWASCLNNLAALTDKVTSCERIRDEPIPLSMAIHEQRLITLFCLAIPAQLVHTLGIWSVPLCSLSAYTYFGIERIARELSDPFGTDINDLPLDAICAAIRREYREIVRDSDASVAGVDSSIRIKDD